MHVVVAGTRSYEKRLGQIHLRKFFRDLLILSINGHYRFASMNQLPLIDVHGFDVSVDSRAYRHNMAVDLCIVSVFVLTMPFFRICSAANGIPSEPRE